MFRIPPGPLTFESAEKLTKAIQGLQRPVSQNYRGGAYTDNIVPKDVFPAKLTAVTSGRYAWTEQGTNGPTYADYYNLPGGRSGTAAVGPAYDPNGTTIDVTGSPIVWLRLDAYNSTYGWMYVIVGSGGGIIRGVIAENANGSITIDPTETFTFSSNLASGELLADLGNDAAGVDLITGRKVRGTLGGNLSYGGNTTMSVSGGGNITVYDWLLSSGQSLANGTQVTAFLDADGKYYVDGAQCPS
jgi:hypothetical protein